jgi:hypothetical protein
MKTGLSLALIAFCCFCLLIALFFINIQPEKVRDIPKAVIILCILGIPTAGAARILIKNK